MGGATAHEWLGGKGSERPASSSSELRAPDDVPGDVPAKASRDVPSHRAKRRARQARAKPEKSHEDIARDYESGLLAASLSFSAVPEHLEFMRMQAERLGEDL